MTSGALVYKVQDRSILLPFYRRFFVDPLLPYIPARLNPNSITHAGHLLNLFGTALLIALWPKGGWPFAFAASMLQAYLWCDNADGAHARRTNQCSAFGEFLDHGLDMMNTVYIGYLTAVALGLSPTWWVVIVILIPGGAALTYWEQATTGVFQLGLLNQVEALTVLSLTLLTSAVFGTEAFERVAVGPVTLRFAMVAWSSSTILFGMARGIVRVGSHRFPRAAGARERPEGLRVVVPVLGWIGFQIAVTCAAKVGVVSTVGAVTLATGGNVYFGMRMLTFRLRGLAPRLETPLVTFALALAGLVVWRLLGQTQSAFVGPVLVTLACAVFGIQAVLDTRGSIQHLGKASEEPGVRPRGTPPAP
jgi:phosphatidylglycerophosphate synthase